MRAVDSSSGNPVSLPNLQNQENRKAEQYLKKSIKTGNRID